MHCSMYIFVDVVKHGVLTLDLVGEIRHDRNDTLQNHEEGRIVFRPR